MNTDLILLGDVLDFFNLKAPTTADDGEYIGLALTAYSGERDHRFWNKVIRLRQNMH